MSALNSTAWHHAFVEESSNDLQSVKGIDSTILLRDFQEHTGNDTAMWKGAVSQHDDANINTIIKESFYNFIARTHFPSRTSFPNAAIYRSTTGTNIR